MKPLAKVLAALNFEKIGPPPVFLQLNGFAAKLAGKSLAQYLQDVDTMVEIQMSAVRKFDNDLLCVFLDSCVEAEALGAKASFSDSTYPSISTPLISDWHQVYSLDLPDPWSAGRMPLMLTAAKRIVEQDEEEHFVVGQVLGPTTIASQIYGIENLIYLIIDDPDGFLELLRFTTQVAERFIGALLTTGVHAVLIHDPTASPDVVSKNMFASRIAPHLKLLIERIKEKHQALVWLQITGNTSSVLPLISDFDVDLVTIDSPVNLGYALQTLPNKVVVGNINPMLFRTKVKDQLSSTLISIREQGRESGYIIGTGCEIPPDAEYENIKYFLEMMGRK